MARTLIAVAVAGAFALPVAAPASAAGDNPPRQASPSTGSGAKSNRGRFDELDKNHDGFVSRDEARDAAELNTRFSELDQNNDGKLSRDEYNVVNSSARGATGTASMSGKAGAPSAK